MAKSTKSRTSWFDETTQTPVIDQHARKLETFVQTLADGQVDAKEMKAQEERLIKLMKEVEPKLDDDLHAAVTQLLCELTAYDVMQMLYTIQEARPKTKFRG